MVKRLLLNRNGQPVPIVRNYPVQYFVAASLFLLAGLVTMAFGNLVGLGLIAFGLCGYAFAFVSYKLL